MKRIAVLSVVLCIVASIFAHPHFRKTLTVKLGEVEATLTYQTATANESRAANTAVGSFVSPRGPRLTLSAALTSGATSIPAGEYTIGVVKESASDWSIALYPGRLGRGATPDKSKIIKLDSVYSNSNGTREHMMIDITAGQGKLAGRAVLFIHFGSMSCAGALT